MTFAEAFQKWLASNSAGMSAGSQSAYGYAVRRFDGFCQARKLTVEEIRRQHIAEWMAEARGEIKGWTVMGQVKLLKRVFEWAVLDGLIAENPIQLKSLPRIARHRAERVAFTVEDYQKIMASLDRAKSYWPLACTMAWHTGLRMGDVANLRWSSVNLVTNLLTVRPIKLARFEQRLEIPIAQELAAMLDDRWTAKAVSGEDATFVQEEMMLAYKYNRTRLVEQFAAICMAASIEGSFHSFRHGTATRLINAGVDSLVIAAITGHSLKQLKDYAHVSNGAKARALALGNLSPVPIGEPSCKLSF